MSLYTTDGVDLVAIVDGRVAELGLHCGQLRAQLREGGRVQGREGGREGG